MGDIEMVDSLLKAGARHDIVCKDGFTALSVASQNGHLAVVQCLIDAGADFHFRNADMMSPIHLAAANGHLEVVQRLLVAFGPEAFKGEETFGVLYMALCMAALEGQTSVVRYLLDEGVMPSSEALCCAAKHGRLGSVQCLVAAGANLNETGLTGKTALSFARDRGYVDVCDYLISMGATDAIPKVRPAAISVVLSYNRVVCDLAVRAPARFPQVVACSIAMSDFPCSASANNQSYV